MPIPEKYRVDFEEEGIYHVYNRTNNREKLFLSDENRRFFLAKYQQYLSPLVGTYCWCLLPNHFHFMLRVKKRQKIINALSAKKLSDLSLTERLYLDDPSTTSELLERAFCRFFQSYSLSFNKVHNRCGNLFQKTFRRVQVRKEQHFTQALVYIHANPVKHKLLQDFTDYKWSSWWPILNGEKKFLQNEMFEWFGNKRRFIDAHHQLVNYYFSSDVSIER